MHADKKSLIPVAFLSILGFFALSNTPDSIAQNFWQATGGLYGGFIRSLFINRTNGHIFTATIANGLFRSTGKDDGWIAVNNGLTNKDIRSFIVNAKGDLLVGTNGGGLFRSTDGGSHWNPVIPGLAGQSVLALVKGPNGHIFAGCAGGIYQSTDDGTTWLLVNNRFQNVEALAINSQGFIFAGVNDGLAGTGIFRSTDNGATWEYVYSHPLIKTFVIDSKGRIFAGSEYGTLFRSMDDGTNWSVVSKVYMPVFSLAVNANDDIFASTFFYGVFRSRDYGETWESVNNDLPHMTVQPLAIDPSGRIFAGTHGNGVFCSTNNGESWTKINNKGFTDVDIRCFATNSIGDVFIGTGSGPSFAIWAGSGIFHSRDNGDSWSEINNGLKHRSVLSLAVNPLTEDIFAGTIGGIYRSTDDGLNWMLIDTGGIISYPVVSFAFNANGHIFALADRIYRSTDDGKSWTHLNSGGSALTISANGHIFVGTTDGRIFRSTDNGGRWSELNTASTIAGITNIAADGKGNILVGTYDGVYRSSDNGNSWDPMNNGLDNTNIISLAVNSSGFIFAATNGGVFRWTDESERWISINKGLPNSKVNLLAVNAEGYLFAATQGGRVFRSVKPSTVIDIPSNFVLKQNRPNPFRTTTTIPFELASQSVVTLKLFNALGQEVATLLVDELPAGAYEVKWNANSLPNGIYFCRMQAGASVQVNKLILLK